MDTVLCLVVRCTVYTRRMYVPTRYNNTLFFCIVNKLPVIDVRGATLAETTWLPRLDQLILFTYFQLKIYIQFEPGKDCVRYFFLFFFFLY